VSSPAFGFFGGSFDPIQKGHIALAQAALRERKLARVYLVPAARSPLKHSGPRASPTDRAALIRAAIRGRPGLALGPWEMDRPGPSWTYQTLRRLRRIDPHRRWELILGEDAWRNFRRWRRWREIVGRVPLIVGKRTAFSGPPGPGGAFILKTRIPAVSSTEIRTAIANGRSVGRWLAAPVARLIKNRGLYSMRSNNSSILTEIVRALSPRRALHSQRVARWASELALRHGADPALAERAGLLHDLAKEWPPARLAAYVRRHKIPVPGFTAILTHRQGGLLHGYVSAHLAKRKGFVRDRPTLQAMARHTLGHPRMELLDKIIYVADFSSPDRRYAEAAHVRRLARRDLDAALRATVSAKIQDVVGRSAFLHPLTVSLWNRS
jgi:nicotinate-nucleotide adenylyltransferase